MNINDHYLDGARICHSPNCDLRPDEEDISLIVIHCISLPPGEFNSYHIDDLFCNRLDPDFHPYFKEICQLEVSAHILISRSGEITQYVPFNVRAWHAGQSEYNGRTQCNDFSIGIELEGTEDIPYTERQYLKLADLTASLLKHYPNLSANRITGHCNIAPGRKTDPGKSFDWEKFFRLLDT